MWSTLPVELRHGILDVTLDSLTFSVERQPPSYNIRRNCEEVLLRRKEDEVSQLALVSLEWASKVRKVRFEKRLDLFRETRAMKFWELWGSQGTVGQLKCSALVRGLRIRILPPQPDLEDKFSVQKMLPRMLSAFENLESLHLHTYPTQNSTPMDLSCLSLASNLKTLILICDPPPGESSTFDLWSTLYSLSTLPKLRDITIQSRLSYLPEQGSNGLQLDNIRRLVLKVPLGNSVVPLLQCFSNISELDLYSGHYNKGRCGTFDICPFSHLSETLESLSLHSLPWKESTIIGAFDMPMPKLKSLRLGLLDLPMDWMCKLPNAQLPSLEVLNMEPTDSLEVRPSCIALMVSSSKVPMLKEVTLTIPKEGKYHPGLDDMQLKELREGLEMLDALLGERGIAFHSD